MDSAVCRRSVFFVGGYEPLGTDQFYRMFRRELKRFRTTWNVDSTVTDMIGDTDDVAHWTIQTSGPNWRTETRYEILRLEREIRLQLATPFLTQRWRELRWLAGDIASGALRRIFRVSTRFGILVAYSQVALLVWIALAALGGGFAAAVAMTFGWPMIAAAISGLVVAAALFVTMKPVADRMFVNQLNTCWDRLRAFARGAPSDFNRSIDLFAERLVAEARKSQADEIILVGHSAGGMFAACVLARALEIDRAALRRGPPLSMLTLGSIMPALALHPEAEALRRRVRPAVGNGVAPWIDAQAEQDFMNFWNVDPVACLELPATPAVEHPAIWRIPFRAMISERYYWRARFNFFRMHYQYIMSNDRRAAYDYFMMICGPVTLNDWVRNGTTVAISFGSDGSYSRATLKARQPSAA